MDFLCFGVCITQLTGEVHNRFRWTWTHCFGLASLATLHYLNLECIVRKFSGSGDTGNISKGSGQFRAVE